MDCDRGQDGQYSTIVESLVQVEPSPPWHNSSTVRVPPSGSTAVHRGTNPLAQQQYSEGTNGGCDKWGELRAEADYKPKRGNLD